MVFNFCLMFIVWSHHILNLRFHFLLQLNEPFNLQLEDRPSFLICYSSTALLQPFSFHRAIQLFHSSTWIFDCSNKFHTLCAHSSLLFGAIEFLIDFMTSLSPNRVNQTLIICLRIYNLDLSFSHSIKFIWIRINSSSFE